MSILCLTCIALLAYNCMKIRKKYRHNLYQIILLLFITYSLTFIAVFVIRNEMYLHEELMLADWEAITISVSYSCFYLAHWIFAWKYWLVAVNIQSLRHRLQGSPWKSYLVFITMSIIIVTICITYGIADGKRDYKTHPTHSGQPTKKSFS